MALNKQYLRSILNRSPIKQGDPALYEVINAILGESEVDVGIFEDWTPVTNAIMGNGKLIGRFVRIGNLIIATIYLVFGSTSSFPGTLIINLPTPVDLNRYILASTPSLSELIVGFFNAVDQSAGIEFIGNCDITFTSGETLRFRPVGGGVVNATVPFTWATDDVLSALVIYEAVQD